MNRKLTTSKMKLIFVYFIVNPVANNCDHGNCNTNRKKVPPVVSVTEESYMPFRLMLDDNNEWRLASGDCVLEHRTVKIDF